MKIRSGFVSNSSSSSFCLWGVELEENEFKSIYKIDDDEDTDMYALLDKKVKGLEYVYSGEDGQLYLGMSPGEMKDHQTLGGFKEDIAKKLSKILKQEVSTNKIRLHYGEIYC